jgi:hypothetical protein
MRDSSEEGAGSANTTPHASRKGTGWGGIAALGRPASKSGVGNWTAGFRQVIQANSVRLPPLSARAQRWGTWRGNEAFPIRCTSPQHRWRTWGQLRYQDSNCWQRTQLCCLLRTRQLCDRILHVGVGARQAVHAQPIVGTIHKPEAWQFNKMTNVLACVKTAVGRSRGGKGLPNTCSGRLSEQLLTVTTTHGDNCRANAAHMYTVLFCGTMAMP